LPFIYSSKGKGHSDLVIFCITANVLRVTSKNKKRYQVHDEKSIKVDSTMFIRIVLEQPLKRINNILQMLFFSQDLFCQRLMNEAENVTKQKERLVFRRLAYSNC